MFTTVGITKLVGAAVLGGMLSMGTAGVAFGATTGGSGTGGSGTGGTSAHHFSCAQAPKVMDRVQRAEARIATALPKLQAREVAALKAGRTKLAARIEARITRLDKLQEKATDVVTRIERNCPNSAAVTPGPGGSGSGTTSTTTA
ncbi:MAG: hypothetical protein ACYDA2_09265 [Acidimicrobiales bacterium]